MDLLLRVLSKVPFPVLYRLSDLAYLLIRYCLRYRLAVVRQNLRRSFPDLGEADIAAIETEFYRGFADILLEGTRIGGMTPDDIRSRITVANPEVVDRLEEEGRRVILVTAHFGSWEWALQWFACRLPGNITALYHPLHDRRTNEYMLKSRSRLGVRFVTDANLVSELRARRQSVNAIAMVADQSPTVDQKRYWTHFLNQETAFQVGLDKLARITDFTVVFVGIKRRRRGYYEMHVEIIGQPPYTKNDRHAIIERFARVTEELILNQPANWLWSHRRWKLDRSRHP